MHTDGNGDDARKRTERSVPAVNERKGEREGEQVASMQDRRGNNIIKVDDDDDDDDDGMMPVSTSTSMSMFMQPKAEERHTTRRRSHKDGNVYHPLRNTSCQLNGGKGVHRVHESDVHGGHQKKNQHERTKLSVSSSVILFIQYIISQIRHFMQWLVSFCSQFWSIFCSRCVHAICAVLRVGAIPAHVAFIMDGNRRYGKQQIMNARAHRRRGSANMQNHNNNSNNKNDTYNNSYRTLSSIPTASSSLSSVYRIGHEAGFQTLLSVLDWSFSLGISMITVFAFSTENFKREKHQVDELMDLLEEKLVHLRTVR